MGTKSPNGLGIYDMSGNVWEWCEDVYDETVYSKHGRNNPVIASGGTLRVFRGGGWGGGSGGLRVAWRDGCAAVLGSGLLGFRLVLLSGQ